MAGGEPVRVFVDADVLIAGSASSSGASHVLLQLGELGLLELVSSARVLAECRRNLLKKLPAAVPAFEALARSACQWVDDPSPSRRRAYAGQADPKDVPILAAALESECTILVTFNTRHYRPDPGTVDVMTPGSLLASIRERLAGLGEPAE